LPVGRIRGYRVSVEMGYLLMNKTSGRARAIAIAQTQESAKLVAIRLLMLATGATAACIAYIVFRAV
jgi:hypothetical protein